MAPGSSISEVTDQPGRASSASSTGTASTFIVPVEQTQPPQQQMVPVEQTQPPQQQVVAVEQAQPPQHQVVPRRSVAADLLATFQAREPELDMIQPPEFPIKR